MIIKEFIAYAKKQEGIVSLAVTSARELDSKTLEKIKSAFGDNVESTESIDASLIGGITVRTSDKIFDASLKTQLIRLKQSLQ